jgi:hypothetical protein
MISYFFFFFFIWGSNAKEDILRGVKLKEKCTCKSNLFNIHYQLEQFTIFYIPMGGWSIKNIYFQCLKCGKIYTLNVREYEQAISLYYQIKEEENRNWVCEYCETQFSTKEECEFHECICTKNLSPSNFKKTSYKPKN